MVPNSHLMCHQPGSYELLLKQEPPGWEEPPEGVQQMAM